LFGATQEDHRGAIMSPHVLIIVTLDTKYEEAAYVRDVLHNRGLSAKIVDCGALGVPGIVADISRQQVAQRAGYDLANLVATGDKGRIIAAMTEGVTGWVIDLYNRGELQGVVGLGGGQGTSMATAAMQELPLGFPKVMVSTLASGNMRPFIESKDIAVFPSVADMLGMNRLLEKTVGMAANAMAAMVQYPPVVRPPAPHTVGVTAFGVTTPGLMKLRRLLEGPELEMVFFHANGAGGAAMESLAREGVFDILLDWTTHEIVDREVGGIFAARDDHLDVLAEREIPCVVSAGAIDYACMGPLEKMPPQWRKRNVIVHNRNITLVRATAEEMVNAADFLAGKLNRALGTVKVMIPLEGFSEPNAKGKQFYDPHADGAFSERLKSLLNQSIELIELPFHINDDGFVKRAADEILQLIPL
jgi:uncharacterized protein (UPF0261 family)